MTRRPPRGQEGQALVIVLGVISVLSLLVALALSVARDAGSRAAREGRASVALQAADAGLSRYRARLVGDPRYWEHRVDAAEDPRIDPAGGTHPPGSAWTPGVAWTYAPAAATWTPLQVARHGRAEYSLRVLPPAAGAERVTVRALGRVGSDTPEPLVRAVEATLAPASIADMQIAAAVALRIEPQVTTQGAIYSGDSVNHLGVAEGPVYGTRFVCASSSGECQGSAVGNAAFHGGAYDSTSSPSFSDVFPAPLDFSLFTQARLDVRSAAQAGGVARDDPSVLAWLVQLLGDGTMRIFRVTALATDRRGRALPIGQAMGSIACDFETVPVPANGAAHFEQPVIVSDASGRANACGTSTGARPSLVDGRLTIATSGAIYVGGEIAYELDGDDVLGLMAASDVVLAEYTPEDLDLRAATVAQSGSWRTHRPNADGRHDALRFRGSLVAAQGFQVGMFRDPALDWDPALATLRPPYFPVVPGSWRTRSWREVQPPS